MTYTLIATEHTGQTFFRQHGLSERRLHTRICILNDRGFQAHAGGTRGVLRAIPES